VPASREGAIGGWWSFAVMTIPITAPECILRVELADSLGGGGSLIADARVMPMGFTSVGDTVISSTYDVSLRYGTGPAAGDVVALTVTDPIPDAVGHQVPDARAGYALAWRFAIVFRCSTWNPTSETYAADGRATLYLNDSPLLTATNVTIPRRPDGRGLRYTVGILGDCDRIWGRTVEGLPATTAEGAFTGSPSGLVYHDDFDSGAYSDWTVTELWPTGGGATPAPNAFADCGGDDGWGLSCWGTGPTEGGGLTVPYTGLVRFLRFPPMVPGQPPPEPPNGEDEEQPPHVAPSYDLDARYIRRLRRAPHVAHENKRVFYRSFELDLERGVGLATGQGSDPIIMLRLSRDGGHTWGEPQLMSAGALGAYTQRVIARRLGQARDTVFEVTVSDPVAWSLVQAWLDLEAGTS